MSYYKVIYRTRNFVVVVILLNVVAAVIAKTTESYCSYNRKVEYWLFSCLFSPILIVGTIAGATLAKWDSCTKFRRVIGVLGYLAFLGWLITGCVWVYETKRNAPPYPESDIYYDCSNCCATLTINFAFGITFGHWFMVFVALILVRHIVKMKWYWFIDTAEVSPTPS